MRLIIGLISVVMLVAPAAYGQVALPSLVPAAPRIIDPTTMTPTASFVTANPAAMQWSETSRWGFGQMGGTIEITSAGSSTLEDFSGFFIGGRKVSETLTFAGQMVEYADQNLLSDWNGVSGGVAFKSGDTITFGASVDRMNNINNLSGTLNALDFNSNALGITLQINPRVYGGVAMGTETITSTLGEDERSVQKFGIAYRKVGETRWHLEAILEDRDAASTITTGDEFSDVSTTTVVAEAAVGNFMLGTSVSSITKNLAAQNISAFVVDVGWAPRAGMSLMAHWESATTDYTATGATSTSTTTALSLSWVL